MNLLEVPHDLAGAHVEAHKARGIHVVAGTMPPVQIAGRRFDRQVHVAKLVVRRKRRPDAGVARVSPGVVAPCVDVRLPRLRNRVESPKFPACLHVEATDEAGNVNHRLGSKPKFQGGPDDDHAVRDHDRRTAADGRQRLEAAAAERPLQIDHAVIAERLNRAAGAGVERHEREPGRDDDDARILAVGPVTDAAPGVAARRAGRALALVEPPAPPLGTSGRVESDDIAVDAGGHVEGAVDVERRRLVLELRLRPDRPEIALPRHAHAADVVPRDLVEWQVAEAAVVTVIGAPFARRWRCQRLRGKNR